MNSALIQSIILQAIAEYSLSMIAIIGTIITVIVGFLVFKKGIHALVNDQSLMIGGFYVRNTPYKGYNRFRSRKWNMEHTM